MIKKIKTTAFIILVKFTVVAEYTRGQLEVSVNTYKSFVKGFMYEKFGSSETIAGRNNVFIFWDCKVWVTKVLPAPLLDCKLLLYRIALVGVGYPSSGFSFGDVLHQLHYCLLPCLMIWCLLICGDK